MSKALRKKETLTEIAEEIVRGNITTADDVVEKYNLTFGQAVTLLSNETFIALVAKTARAVLNVAWYSKAMPRLIQMMDSRDDKTALAAMKMAGQINEQVKGGGNLEININLESMVSQLEKGISNNLKHPGLENVIEMDEFRKVMNE